MQNIDEKSVEQHEKGKITHIREIVRAKQAVKRVKDTFRKKFKIKPLPPEEIADGGVFLVGNEPEFPHVPAHLKAQNKFALVGTSCLKALEVASIFCAKGTMFIPRIYVVDNDKNVAVVWETCKEIFAASSNIYDFQEIVRINNPDDADEIITLVNRILKSDFSNGDKEAGFLRLKKMMSAAIITTHDWTVKEPFKKIKARCDAYGWETYIYPSNILSCLASKEDKGTGRKGSVDRMKENIKILNPRASLYSNFVTNSHGYKPDKFTLYEGSGLNDIDEDILWADRRAEEQKQSASSEKAVKDKDEAFTHLGKLYASGQYKEALPYAKKVWEISEHSYS